MASKLLLAFVSLAFLCLAYVYLSAASMDSYAPMLSWISSSPIERRLPHAQTVEPSPYASIHKAAAASVLKVSSSSPSRLLLSPSVASSSTPKRSAPRIAPSPSVVLSSSSPKRNVPMSATPKLSCTASVSVIPAKPSTLPSRSAVVKSASDAKKCYGVNDTELSIYVYEMPPKFTSDLLQESTRDGNCECCQSFYGNEVDVHRMLLASKKRTRDPAKANLFYVPVFTSCLIKIGARVRIKQPDGVDGYFPDTKRVGALLREAWLHIRETYPYWDRSGGSDHVWTFTQGFGSELFDQQTWEAVSSGIVMTNNGQFSERRFRVDRDIVLPGKLRSFYESQSIVMRSERQQRKFFQGRNTRIYFGGTVIPNLAYSGGLRQELKELATTGQLSSQVRADFSTAGWTDIVSPMMESFFCLCFQGWWAWTPRPYESVLHGCIPVIVSDDLLLPFESQISWNEFSLKFSTTRSLKDVIATLETVSDEEIQRLQRGVANHAGALSYMKGYTLVEPYIVRELAARTPTHAVGGVCVATTSLLVTRNRSTEWGFPGANNRSFDRSAFRTGGSVDALRLMQTCSIAKTIPLRRDTSVAASPPRFCWDPSLASYVWDACDSHNYGRSLLGRPEREVSKVVNINGQNVTLVIVPNWKLSQSENDGVDPSPAVAMWMGMDAFCKFRYESAYFASITVVVHGQNGIAGARTCARALGISGDFAIHLLVVPENSKSLADSLSFRSFALNVAVQNADFDTIIISPTAVSVGSTSFSIPPEIAECCVRPNGTCAVGSAECTGLSICAMATADRGDWLCSKRGFPLFPLIDVPASTEAAMLLWSSSLQAAGYCLSVVDSSGGREVRRSHLAGFDVYLSSWAEEFSASESESLSPTKYVAAAADAFGWRVV